MIHWNHDQLQQLAGERTPQKVFDLAVNLAQDLDMTFLGYRLRLQLAAQAPKVYHYSNYPSEWVACCERDDLHRQDAAAVRSHNSTLPVLWTDELYREVPHFREQACLHGLRHGWTQSLHDLQHNESQVSVSRPMGEISTSELYDKAGRVQWLCHSMHAIISDYHLTRLSAPPLKMSERELEVLKWSAAGKTAADVACILSLSQSTVNFHIRSVIAKTNATNKAGAIAIALMRGLIE
ncbi:LuxR family transcriptional regulator [Pantoea sp. Tr-811]|uniref:autoinducer binding domain-containing protein n=1 Tax=Pantoea sp. Tr-811 TaxID=2608361 RepID=UPI001423A040|nr:autoinducer binding domain-containing protein [Pantoea sp. Tr-811]NIF26125.1 LuxR family transcriptional regulator [Pantoea sp. Tr-811]